MLLILVFFSPYCHKVRQNCFKRQKKMKKQLASELCNAYFIVYTDRVKYCNIANLIIYTDKMVFTKRTLEYFSLIQYHVRTAVVKSVTSVPFAYEEESFFKAYNALEDIWRKRISQRQVAHTNKVSREKLKEWEKSFIKHGTVGLLPDLSFVVVDSKLERLVVLIKSCRPHERANFILRLARIFEFDDVSLEMIRHIQRCYGYGHRMDAGDIVYFQELQHILYSVMRQKQKTATATIHSTTDRSSTFINYTHDFLQHKVELMKQLSQCKKRRQIRPILLQFGVTPNRFYLLKKRYMQYGVWGLVNLNQKGHIGEKISPALELRIIEQRLMNPHLSTSKMIKKFNLHCSRANVQRIYTRWNLSAFKSPVSIRGVISHSIPEKLTEQSCRSCASSARAQFPDLIARARLKVNLSFSRFMESLSHKSVYISNPGALLAAPLLDQLGVVESLRTYGPSNWSGSEITNNIIVNVIRIIAGFSTINNYTVNSDRSVAIGAGLSLNPTKSRFYDSLDEIRFTHLQKLRNDASCRARELGIITAEEIAIDYHCDPCDSRFPHDKSLSKSPDKNGNVVYAHRPQIIWDSITNSIINIAYCEGSSRATSALYSFCEQNLFKIIDPDAVSEIYADSEYTGEKQLVYLAIRSTTNITMCLKQNPKIKKWKEETMRLGQWQDYGQQYRIICNDYILAQTRKPFRFIVKQNKETGEVRCFGSTHVEKSAPKILDSYHIRWPVETGIKDLIENYFLNKPTGTSPEKIEMHYYCVMLARLTIDYFISLLAYPRWRTPEEWECVLSTIRSSIFSNQNCKLSLHESGDFMITYLDGDRQGVKKKIAQLLLKRKNDGLNKCSWWGNKGVRIDVKDQYQFRESVENIS